ncbi:unnamed protein product [Merluccius merluccius]
MQEVPTRWNNTLEMVKCLQINQEPLRDALDLHKTNVTMPTNAELEKLQRLEALLELCRFKDLKCLPRSERAELWALLAGILKEEMLAQQQQCLNLYRRKQLS